ncbi:acyltransferase [Ktedonospora formicarum]|uniref:Acetyltransferase n=1 Tax=Ktedonospora formicarum TaxID=2778364 RepID=A0A8J3HY70_9CHLR|nr:acyltransferase [Ktedonospora formicarum]GHO43290.1 hypothetical protein KSX_14530 [Ktedonospora formicarum]
MKHVLNAALKYATNHIIGHIPSRRLRLGWYRRVLGWRIGHGTQILMGQHIQLGSIRQSKVNIGHHVAINHGCLLYATGGIIIGDNVSIGAGSWLVTGSHELNDPGFPDTYKPIVIEDYAWLGVRCTILQGITIGRGAVVMAGAVVTRDVPPFAIVGGVPAKVLKYRELREPAYTLNFSPLFE